MAVVVIAAVAGIATADLGSAACISPQSLELPCPEQRRELVSQALSFAALNGESRPTSGLLVATTRRAFNGLFGADTDTDQKVYAIVLRGDFVGNLASRPHGAPAPTGHVLALVYDATGNTATDWSLGPRPTMREVRQLGPSEPVR